MYVYSPVIIITVENTHKNENKIFTLFQWNFDKKYYILGSLAISREVKKHCNIRLDGCVRVEENSSLQLKPRDYKLFMDNHLIEQFENN